MPTYTCTVRRENQQIGETVRTAPNLPALAVRLQAAGWELLKAREIQTGGRRGWVSAAELTAFYRHLAAMLRAGLPLVDGLRLIGQEVYSPALQRALHHISETVAAGGSLADALAHHPHLFDATALGLIRAGEESGTLPEAFEELAEQRETFTTLARKLAPLMVYPATVGVFFLFLTTFLLTFILPKFIKLFQELGINEFPLPTQMLIYGGRLAAPLIFFLGLPLGVVLIVIWIYRRTLLERLFQGLWAWLLPFARELLRTAALARVTRTLGLLLGRGMPVVEALELTSRTAGERRLERALSRAAGQVAMGSSLSEALKAQEVFPPTLTWRLGVAEASQEVAPALCAVADFYLHRVELLSRSLTAVLEPVLIILLGGCLGFMIVGMFLPLVSIIRCLSGG